MPVYFLDADLPSNAEWDRNLTGGLLRRRFLLPVVPGSFARNRRSTDAARSGLEELTRYHMNEGHAALLSLELLGEEAIKAGRTAINGEDIEKVRAKRMFTTHTPGPPCTSLPH